LAGAIVEMERRGEELVAADGRRVKIADAHHLSPVQPGKIIAVHLNHVSRVHEFQIKLSATPTYFQKPTSALNAHRGEVVRPKRCKWLNYEGEVAIVIGRTCRNIAQKDAGDYIRGYTVANDFGLHDFRDTDAGSMLRVKGSDTLCPLGPGLVEGWDFHNKYLRTYVNGQLKQDGNTAEMTWDMHYLVADIARNITLEPGDVLLSGTPASRGRSRFETISARSRPNPRKCSRPLWAAIGNSAASARRNAEGSGERYHVEDAGILLSAQRHGQLGAHSAAALALFRRSADHRISHRSGAGRRIASRPADPGRR
jgi:5-oxopent-3-ene-1,2,5-tricarboxylate decarboxylase/2-hydroxyhepta-2,4-diene-1,7-dioate isomerase